MDQGTSSCEEGNKQLHNEAVNAIVEFVSCSMTIPPENRSIIHKVQRSLAEWVSFYFFLSVAAIKYRFVTMRTVANNTWNTIIIKTVLTIAATTSETDIGKSDAI